MGINKAAALACASKGSSIAIADIIEDHINPGWIFFRKINLMVEQY